jgi:hypothetical protein
MSDLPKWADLPERDKARIAAFVHDAEQERDISSAWDQHRRSFNGVLADAEGWQVFDAYDGCATAPELAEGEYAPGYVPARDVEPGTTVSNPNVGWKGDDRDMLDVVAVSDPDDQEMVTITCLTGPPVRVADWYPMELDTPADAEHRALIALDVLASTDESESDQGGAS